MTRSPILTLLAMLAAGPAMAASLRPFGTLSGPLVAVADLWDGAGEAASRVLGPGPAPGERIVVETAQLAAIARQFGVDWRPDAGASRSILERPGTPLPRETVEAALRAWLLGAGAPPGALELAEFTAPLVDRGSTPTATVTQGGWTPANNRFTASLAVTGPGLSALRLLVAGRIVVVTRALVAGRRLAAGTILATSDTQWEDVPRERLRGPVAEAVEQATGWRLRRTLAPGEPLLLADLAPPLLVAKGAVVSIAIDAAGVSLVASGEALRDGALGERIEVRNPASRAVLLARVSGRGTVRVEPGSLPVRPPGSAATP